MRSPGRRRQVAGVCLQVGDNAFLPPSLSFAQGCIGGQVLQCSTHLARLIQKSGLLSLGFLQESCPFVDGCSSSPSPPCLSFLHGLCNVSQRHPGSTVGLEELMPEHGRFAFLVVRARPRERRNFGRWLRSLREHSGLGLRWHGQSHAAPRNNRHRQLHGGVAAIRRGIEQMHQV